MAATVTAILVQAALPVAPPPAPPAPPIVYVSPPRSTAAPARDRYVVDVEVRAGGETLWSGPMTVATAQSATFTRRLSEPAPDDCGPGGYGQQVENSLMVQLGPERPVMGDVGVGLSVRWGRSVPGACPYRASSRSVELNQVVTLAPGRMVVVSGDADLTVRLRRR